MKFETALLAHYSVIFNAFGVHGVVWGRGGEQTANGTDDKKLYKQFDIY